MLKNYLSKPVCHLLLVIILGVVSYSNSLNVPFYWDDMNNIVANPIIKNLDYYLSPSTAVDHKGLTEYPLLINRYIGSLSFALNYRIHALDVRGYHAVNLLIHLINSLLIYWFVQLVFLSLAAGDSRNKPLFSRHASTIALFASMLFVTHPIQTQAVTYIVQRFASLATMFYLLAITLYIKTRLTLAGVYRSEREGGSRPRAAVYYLAALFAAVLAMKTKEIAFTLPVMIVLSEFLFFTGEVRRRILYLLPFAMTMLIIPATLITIVDLEGGGGSATRLMTDMSRQDYLFTEFRVLITYIRLIFWPVGQNLDYDYPVYHSILDPAVLLSCLALLTACLAIIYSFWRYRLRLPLVRAIFFGSAWFFITISVESGLIPIVDVIFEHRMYLPSFGIFLAISVLLVMIIDKYRQPWVERAVFLSVITAVLILTGLTFARNRVWNDKTVMWQDVVNKSPEKPRGYGLLANAYQKKGTLLATAARTSPAIKRSKAEVYYNLGQASAGKGLGEESIKAYKNAIKIDPSFAAPHFELSKSYLKKALYRQLKIEKANAENPGP